MKEIAKVYEEENYDVFRRLKDNREVLRVRIDKLKKSFQRADILNPIIVNEKMEIVDGQGRFEARKELGLPIQYIIVPGIGSKECKILNLFNTIWKLRDFCLSWAKNGNKNYRRLLDVSDEEGITLSDSLLYANKMSTSGGHNNRVNKQNIVEGKLIFEEKDAKIVKLLAQHVRNIRAALTFNKKFNETFKRAIVIAYQWPGYDPKKFEKNCASNRADFAQTSNLNSMLAEVERIYNQKNKDKLFFTDYMRNKGENVRDYSKTKAPTTGKDESTLQG